MITDLCSEDQAALQTLIRNTTVTAITEGCTCAVIVNEREAISIKVEELRKHKKSYRDYILVAVLKADGSAETDSVEMNKYLN